MPSPLIIADSRHTYTASNCAVHKGLNIIRATRGEWSGYYRLKQCTCEKFVKATLTLVKLMGGEWLEGEIGTDTKGCHCGGEHLILVGISHGIPPGTLVVDFVTRGDIQKWLLERYNEEVSSLSVVADRVADDAWS